MLGIEINFPVEFIIEGVPLAQRASAASLEKWKARVADAARAQLQEGHWATTGPVAITILYFPIATMRGDVDNIVKPILDALNRLVYIDDRQVERIWVQKFEPGRVLTFSEPTPTLADALERDRPVLYVRIDDEITGGVWL
jgi:crossover junction endodeoxyribonuclease RusA